MFEIDVLGGNANHVVAETAKALELLIVSEGTLKTYPGSRHWHMKRPGAWGTLEVTVRPELKKLYVIYHANRIGNGWVVETAPKMAEMLSRALDGSIDQAEISGSV